MTTMSEPLEDMAKAAVDTVLALSEQQKVEERTRTFPIELIERDSVR